MLQAFILAKSATGFQKRSLRNPLFPLRVESANIAWNLTFTMGCPGRKERTWGTNRNFCRQEMTDFWLVNWALCLRYNRSLHLLETAKYISSSQTTFLEHLVQNLLYFVSHLRKRKTNMNLRFCRQLTVISWRNSLPWPITKDIPLQLMSKFHLRKSAQNTLPPWQLQVQEDTSRQQD